MKNGQCTCDDYFWKESKKIKVQKPFFSDTSLFVNMIEYEIRRKNNGIVETWTSKVPHDFNALIFDLCYERRKKRNLFVLYNSSGSQANGYYFLLWETNWCIYQQELIVNESNFCTIYSTMFIVLETGFSLFLWSFGS